MSEFTLHDIKEHRRMVRSQIDSLRAQIRDAAARQAGCAGLMHQARQIVHLQDEVRAMDVLIKELGTAGTGC